MSSLDIWEGSRGRGRKKKLADSYVMFGGGSLGIKPLKVKPISSDFGLNSSSNAKTRYERVPITNSQRKKVLIKQKNKCAWPGCKIRFYTDGVTPHFDHKRRVDKGGPSKVDNLQALCPNHHQRKTDEENVKEAEKRRKKAKMKRDNSLSLGFNISRKNSFY